MADLAGFDTSPHAYWLKVAVGTALLLFESAISIVSSSVYAKSAFYLFVVQMLAVILGTVSLFGRPSCTPPPAVEGTAIIPANATDCFSWLDEKAVPNPHSAGGAYQVLH